MKLCSRHLPPGAALYIRSDFREHPRRRKHQGKCVFRHGDRRYGRCISNGHSRGLAKYALRLSLSFPERIAPVRAAV